MTRSVVTNSRILDLHDLVLQRGELAAQARQEPAERIFDMRVERLAFGIEQPKLPQVLHHIPGRWRREDAPPKHVTHNASVDEGWGAEPSSEAPIV